MDSRSAVPVAMQYNVLQCWGIVEGCWQQCDQLHMNGKMNVLCQLGLLTAWLALTWCRSWGWWFIRWCAVWLCEEWGGCGLQCWLHRSASSVDRRQQHVGSLCSRQLHHCTWQFGLIVNSLSGASICVFTLLCTAHGFVNSIGFILHGKSLLPNPAAVLPGVLPS